MYILDDFFITLKDSTNVVKNCYRNIKDFVGPWDLKDTMCNTAMDFKVVYPNIHVQYVHCETLEKHLKD
jgi:hypothetical protein